MLIDEFLPVYDVSDSVATLVRADVRTTWDALTQVNLIEVGRKRPLVGVLGALRVLPDVVAHLMHGQAPPKSPTRLRLRDMPKMPAEAGRWTLLGDRPVNEIALGLVGKFWKPVIEFAAVSPREFRDFAAPGFAKTIYSLSVQRLGDHRTFLAAMMRTATTDEHARRWFRRYWTLGVGSGAHVLVQGLLDATREIAEAKT
jgi:hypothetical protein